MNTGRGVSKLPAAYRGVLRVCHAAIAEGEQVAFLEIADTLQIALLRCDVAVYNKEIETCIIALLALVRS